MKVEIKKQVGYEDDGDKTRENKKDNITVNV